MRYCNQCHRLTIGEPLFCNFCGSSYNVKLCPSRHVNPRNAEVCSQCGSRDFSTPAPRINLWVRPLLWIGALVPGVLLALLSILVLVGTVRALVAEPQALFQVMLAGLILAFLWYAYIRLPKFIRDLFQTIWRKPKKDR